jgi:hypothetical protein
MITWSNSVARRESLPLSVHLDEPLAKLLLEILFVQESSLLEERTLDPFHQVLDRALVFRTVRPAQLDSKTRSNATPANVGFHFVTCPSRPQ